MTPRSNCATTGAAAPHLRHVVEGGARQAKVADLELAVGVGQNVLGLQVAVEHLRKGRRKQLKRGQLCSAGKACSSRGTPRHTRPCVRLRLLHRAHASFVYTPVYTMRCAHLG